MRFLVKVLDLLMHYGWLDPIAVETLGRVLRPKAYRVHKCSTTSGRDSPYSPKIVLMRTRAECQS